MRILWDLLVQPFYDGDWIIGVVFWALFGLFFLMICYGILQAIEEVLWSFTPAFEFSAHLVSSNLVGSTEETDVVPTFTANGAGMGVVTTGHGEQRLTVWDCGEYGRLVSDDEVVFQYAKPKATLFLKTRGGHVRIEGIKTP